MNFEVNDRVVAVGNDLFANVQPGEMGTIIRVEFDDTLAVRWDCYHEDAHDCNIPELCENGYGTYVGPNEIELLDIGDDLAADILSCSLEEII